MSSSTDITSSQRTFRKRKVQRISSLEEAIQNLEYRQQELQSENRQMLDDISRLEVENAWLWQDLRLKRTCSETLHSVRLGVESRISEPRVLVSDLLRIRDGGNWR